MNRPFRIVLLLVVLWLSLSLNAQQQTPDQPVYNRATEAVNQALAADGAARVIIVLRLPEAVAMTGNAINNAQNAALASLTSNDFALIYRYRHAPALAGIITPGGVQALRTNPSVAAIQLDEPVTGFLDEAQPLIQADTARTQFSVTGAGVRVAIVDSGVDLDHPDLADDIVGQQCFATGDCEPGDVNQSASGQDEHGHGTHVAGIVSSSGAASELGVAPDAGIVAVRVLNSQNAGFTSDIHEGLEWIITNQGTLNVDIVNMSLGTTTAFTGNCDASQPTYATLLGQLNGLGVTVFVSSGNDALASQMSAPACNSDSIAVGATYDADVGGITYGSCSDSSSAPDQIACFSNAGEMLDILAPGSLITSSALDGTGITRAGTSMASPMAAGVAALMKENNPDLTPADIKAVLEQTGVTIVDNRNGQAWPRVDALKAVEQSSNNDELNGALPITSLPYTLQRTNTSATAAGDDPTPTGCAASVSNTVWFSYTAPTNGAVTLNTFGSTFDTVLAVYEGATVGDLNFIGCDDGDVFSNLTFNVMSGTTYAIMLGGDNGANGTYTLEATLNLTGTPEVVSTTPTDGNFDVATNTNVDIAFNRNVDITASAVALDCDGTPVSVVFNPALPANGIAELTLDPVSDLPGNALCTLTLTPAEITNSADASPLGGDTTFTFTPTLVRQTVTENRTPNTEFGDTPLPNPLQETITITDNGTLASMTAEVSLTHGFMQDVVINLSNPVGTPVLLINERGGFGDDMVNTVFDDNATTPISAGSAPFTGSFRPEEPLSTFNGTEINGDWVFSFADVEEVVDGTVTEIALNLTYLDDPFPPEVESLLVTDVDLTLTFDEPVSLAADTVTVECPSAVTYTGLPVTDVTSVTLTFDAPIGSGTSCTVTVSAATTTDRAGNQLDGNGDGTGGDDYIFTESAIAATPTPTATATPTDDPSITPTPTPTDDPNITPTATATDDPNLTPTPTATDDPNATPTATATDDPNATPTATDDPNATPTATATSQPGEVSLDGDLNSELVRPTFRWRVDPNDIKPWYGIFVYDLNDVLIFNVWKEDQQVCMPFTGECAYTPTADELPIGFQNGSYTWEVQSWEAGVLAQVGESSFAVNAPEASAPNGIGVNVSSGRPVVTFLDDDGAGWINVVINDATTGDTVHQQWYPKSDATCDELICTLTPFAFPMNGSYELLLQFWGPAGFNGGDPALFTGPFAFSIDFAPAGAINALTATVASDGTPTFTWEGERGTTWYQIWVGPADYSDTLLNQWYEALPLGCNGTGTCTLTVPEVNLRTGITYEWWARTWGPGGINNNLGPSGWVRAGQFTP